MEQIASVHSAKAPAELGVSLIDGGVEAAVYSRSGERIWFCQFDQGGVREIARWRLAGRDGDIHYGFVPGIEAGARYGLRADGPYEPERGHRFDPAKLLVDPYARRIDRPFAWRVELAAPRMTAVDTAAFTPRSIVEAPAQERMERPRQPLPAPGLIYEIAPRSFTRQHPQVPSPFRGTLSGLADPALIEHLQRLGVSHVELMPVAAWVDERHLSRLGLANAWGYNPVTFMALDPRLAPHGLADLRRTVAALHGAGIGVILDVVFNHSGEGDAFGPTLSLRGLDNAVYYRHTRNAAAALVNDTGCGNTLACDRPPVIRLCMDALRLYAGEAHVDGFRFDLATTIARDDDGFSPSAPLLSAIAQDPMLRGRILIAEPWDVGPGGYRLGRFPPQWQEWNDRFRDGVRKFWRGDADACGDFVTRIAGSPDLFEQPGRRPSASVNFLAAHDGFTLRDCVSYESRRNHANGEDNRDGHADNHSWNCGVEGETADAKVLASRTRDVRALLASLFVARGAPMLTAGDEFGRSQHGNNNAYAQDNATTWLDWENADRSLLGFVAALAHFRRECLATSFERFLTGQAPEESMDETPDVVWLQPDGAPMRSGDWRDADAFCMTLAGLAHADFRRIHIGFNRSANSVDLALPLPDEAHVWRMILCSASGYVDLRGRTPSQALMPSRGVVAFAECPIP